MDHGSPSNQESVVTRFFRFLGKRVITRTSSLLHVFTLIYSALVAVPATFRQGRHAAKPVLMKQIYFTGLEASVSIVTIAAIIGSVIVMQVIGLMGTTSGSFVGKMMVWIVLRELAPLITAVIVVARSGTAIATELAAMKINGEIELIQFMGIHTERYLILPRIIGVTLSVVVLSVYFVMTSFAGGFLLSFLGWRIPYEHFAQGVMATMGLLEIFMLFGKSFIFGLIISATCCSEGLSIGSSATEIPQAATRGVMASLFMIFMVNAVITFLASYSF